MQGPRAHHWNIRPSLKYAKPAPACRTPVRRGSPTSCRGIPIRDAETDRAPALRSHFFPSGHVSASTLPTAVTRGSGPGRTVTQTEPGAWGGAPQENFSLLHAFSDRFDSKSNSTSLHAPHSSHNGRIGASTLGVTNDDRVSVAAGERW